MRWLITYRYRRHNRPGLNKGVLLDVGHGEKTEIIDMHPIEWLEMQRTNEVKVAGGAAGEYLTCIVVLFAIAIRDDESRSYVFTA